ncbi:hypothetical protein Q5752_005636 [Cryptotrichosporon argae]
MATRPRLDSARTSSSTAWPRPVSPTFSTTTTGSKVDLGDASTLISRKDLRQSIACFEELVAAAKAYRNALLAMSTATAAFASAMEACSRVKGCHGAAAPLAGSAGLQYLISNHEQLLADTVYRQLEIPLLEALDHYRLETAERLASYEKRLVEQSNQIRKTEAENMRIGRRRKRDLVQFRQALAELQKQVDELDQIKVGYHEEVLEAEDETWDTVLSKVAFVVRSQLDFYEKIAGKASDPVLEPLVMSIPDPFDAYGPPKEDGHIISVLAPLSMLDSTPHSPTPNLPRVSQPSSSSSPSTPRHGSPAKVAFPTSASAQAESALSYPYTAPVFATGEADAESADGSGARRELGVIEEREREGSMSDDRREANLGDDPQLGDDDAGRGGKSGEASSVDDIDRGRVIEGASFETNKDEPAETPDAEREDVAPRVG